MAEAPKSKDGSIPNRDYEDSNHLLLPGTISPDFVEKASFLEAVAFAALGEN
jgi:hypothetical protein